MSSEVTAAALDVTASIRNDPFAMKPFMGYNVGDYCQHWLDVGAAASSPEALPRIFMVNWFRKTEEGKWMWPGFGDNVRVLEWVMDRCNGAKSTMATVETPIGFVPDAAKGGINMAGLNLSEDVLKALFTIDAAAWKKEMEM